MMVGFTRLLLKTSRTDSYQCFRAGTKDYDLTGKDSFGSAVEAQIIATLYPKKAYKSEFIEEFMELACC
jgi:hypothetical protein